MFLSTLLVVACSGPEPGDPIGPGPLGLGLTNPFPNTSLLDAGGHLALSELPSGGEAPIPIERLAWRTGFSPAQTAVLRLPGIDPGALPSFGAIEPGLGSVRLVDRTEGSYLPCMAELDAYPSGEDPALLIRPLTALPYGHDVAVVVLTDAVARPEGFHPEHSTVRPLIDELVALGIAEAEIAVAWSFPVADGTQPLRSALEQISVLGPPTFTEIREVDDDVAPLTWRAAEGTFPVVDFLIDDRLLDLGPDGSVSPTGQADAYLYVHVPTSVSDAPAGSVPVLVFGHGIFGEPSNYLDDREDADGLLALADEGGFIVVATNWRGLTAVDRAVPLGIAGDFGRFPELTDLLVQGQANTRTLIEGIKDGSLIDDPVFRGESGQPLPDPDHVFYYGISLGGIEGAVMLAHDPPLDATALHVGGAMWSTMLERSSNWYAFELLLVPTVPSAGDRQLLYALTQLWWDAVDPMAYALQLQQTPLLLQESIGDEQVPNLTTEAFARAAGLPLLSPAPTTPWGLSLVEGPLPEGSRALVQFDPELPLPEPTNRPAETSGAHTTPRGWSGVRRQVIDHLSPGAPGQVVHHCGAQPCSASSPGDD
ncbi:MAG TPA: hypothetical protein ENK18_27700 [Deltaproteobacteria bacterium]|nr:hypothetical protein [Deltaproteobacteria bacterium]